MPALARTIATPLLVDIRHGAVETLPALLCDSRISTQGEVAVAVGPGIGEEIAETIREVLPDAPIFRVRGGSMDSAQELLSQVRASFYDALVGIGGGGTIDVAKYAASMRGLPFVSVATNLAHDGVASPVSVLEMGGRKASYGVHIPMAVIVDLDYVARSPDRHLRAGIGDAISNLSAVADWELAHRDRDEPIDGLAVALARTGAESLLNRQDAATSTPFLTALAEALFLSGMAMAVAGSSRPCSGGCHEISHAIDALYPDIGLHGEQVALGTLFTCYLRDDPQLGAINDCFRRYGLPRVPADLGLSEEQFIKAVISAPTTRPDRHTILEHLDMDVEEVRERVEGFVAAVAG